MKTAITSLLAAVFVLSCSPSKPPKKPVPPQVFISPYQHDNLNNTHSISAAMIKLKYLC
jgi:hypothetical protein